MTLEQDLIHAFAGADHQRNQAILIEYYGWADGRRHTLTEIGTRFGVTRERVRQVCAKLTKHLEDPATAPAPALDRALAMIDDLVPCSADRIEAELVAQGLTAIGMTIEAVAVGAKLLGRAVDFKVVKSETGRLVIRPEQYDDVLAAMDTAKKDVYFHGLATVQQIAEAVAAENKRKADSSLTRQTLMLMNGFCWLDEPTGWFHLASIQRHGLPKAIDKVLAVAGRVTVAQLCKALSRNRRLWREPPPAKVLSAFCRQMPGVRITDDWIISDPPRDWRKALTGVEAKLVEVLMAHGPLMERGAMEDLCVAEGMNRFSFHAFISWSPVIVQYGHSIYGLLGAEVSSQRVKKMLVERRANHVNHRVLDRHGQTEDGRVWLSYRLSKAASTYAVITVPAALKTVVQGSFQLLSSDGREIGTLATKDGRAWGLGAFLRQQGASIGDRIVLTLDLEKRTAAVSWEESA